MICQHLRELEEAIIAAGIAETFRGQAWTTNCLEWDYFDCYLDEEKIRQRFALSMLSRPPTSKVLRRPWNCAKTILPDFSPSLGVKAVLFDVTRFQEVKMFCRRTIPEIALGLVSIKAEQVRSSGYGTRAGMSQDQGFDCIQRRFQFDGLVGQCPSCNRLAHHYNA